MADAVACAAMTPDPRTPVIVGVGQVTQRTDDPAEALEPVDLLAEAARAAGTDAGAALLDEVDAIAVADIISWRYPDPGALLARRLGIEPRTTIMSTVGGNSPQMLATECSRAISERQQDVALVGGVECMHTRWRARREPKTWLDWTQADDPPCAEVWGNPAPGSNDYEMAHLAAAPVQVYPLFETALRASAGADVATHQARTSELWARLALVSAGNPHAWSPVAYTAEQIRTVSLDNRMVAFPYTKRMCANLGVDQAAATLLCSYETARSAGVADDRMVFPLAGGDSREHYFVTERESLATAPGLGIAIRQALDGAGVGVDDVARFDLYSCFPSAVEMAIAELGLADDDPRPVTVTGGLAFAGGPGNSYANHSIAAMVEACRADPGSVGMVTALGWYITKHAVALYSTTPPERGFRNADADAAHAEIAKTPSRTPAGAYEGNAIVEATSVIFERDGEPTVAIVAALTPDGRRALANTRDREVMVAMTDEPWEGRTVELTTDGNVNSLRASASIRSSR